MRSFIGKGSSAFASAGTAVAVLAGPVLLATPAAAADREGNEGRAVGWHLQTGRSAFWGGTHTLDSGSPAFCLDFNLYGPKEETDNGYRPAKAPNELSEDTKAQLAHLAARYGKLPDTSAGRNTTAAASLLSWALADRDGVDESGFNGEKIPWQSWLDKGMPKGAVSGYGADSKVDTAPVVSEFNRLRGEVADIDAAPYALTVPDTGKTFPYERTPAEKSLTVKLAQGSKPVPGVQVNTTRLDNVAKPQTPGAVGATDARGEAAFAFTPAEPGLEAGAGFTADVTVNTPTFWATDKKVSGHPMQRLIYFAAEKKTLAVSGSVRFEPASVVIALKKDRKTGKPVASPATYEIRGNRPSGANGAPGDLITTVTTGKDGRSEPVDLTAGVYWMVETRAPEGYEFDPTPQRFEVKPGDQAVITVLNSPVARPTTPPVTPPPTTPPVTTPPTSPPSTPPSPSASDAPPATPPSDGELAKTGASRTTQAAVIAGGLLLAGGIALIVTRRRRNVSSSGS
ncbi:SpaA isopeptide-forming pilin-related protein [Streptomyces sp. NPDC057638]|uniref:SpaA isopeptide-forming pilin-related protein n=1 Tax=Streptomyces sp. NPDC057638 TaxID=3346190 RepID=UPI0036AF5FB7